MCVILSGYIDMPKMVCIVLWMCIQQVLSIDFLTIPTNERLY